MSYPSVCGILDMPDEILVMIILHFDARERLALGNSCQRFNDLVFGDEKLLRNLDFTGEWQRWQLTQESDIQQYFTNENTYKKILGINTENVSSVSRLENSIGKAINLVELNILNGLEFSYVEELSRFLKPLVHLKRLSVNLPRCSRQRNIDNPELNYVLKEPFSRLTYLSLKITELTEEFLLILQLCQQLEEFRTLITEQLCDYSSPLPQEPIKLSNLKSVRIKAIGSTGLLIDDLMSIVPDPTEWTEFYLVNSFGEYYFEKNVEVCAELEHIKEMPLPRHIAEIHDGGSINMGWPLVVVPLLSEVIRATHEDVPEKFCSLSWSESGDSNQPGLLEMDEAKKLLKDPEYQVSFLRIFHSIEKNCDVHLYASAFPSLTKLCLLHINNRNLPEKTEPLQRRLRKKGSLVSEEEYSDAQNMDSSFKILVENTPRLEVLEISPDYWQRSAEDWDMDALYLISGWKNLTVIRLYYIPITDGQFLIDIGRECKKLKEVKLHDLGPYENCIYESELLQMLQHCKNLRKLSITEPSLKHVSEMFGILSNCSKLADFQLESKIEESDPLALTSSVEKMLRQCQELNRFSMCTSYLFDTSSENRPIDAVRRIISELNRSDFQFELYQPDDDDFLFPEMDD